MDCSWLESSALDRTKAADELLRGREFAQQLRAHLRRRSGCGGTASEDLLSRILSSLTKTLSILNGSSHSDINNSLVDYIDDEARKPAESGDSRKNSSTPANDRRGSYKRRKNSHSWARESESVVDDGHAWRKYGQKQIQNSKFARNYYRCTHKYDQSCEATKQVQQLEHDTPKFRTTYYGKHTCTNFLNPSEIVLHSSSCDDDSHGILFSFNSPAPDRPDRILFPAEKEQGAAGELCSPDHFSEVMMVDPVDDFEDDVFRFHF